MHNLAQNWRAECIPHEEKIRAECNIKILQLVPEARSASEWSATTSGADYSASKDERRLKKEESKANSEAL